MCADLDAIEAAIIFSCHVVLALGNGALDVGVLFHFVHHKFLFPRSAVTAYL